jgi:hypothetical protein
MSGLPIYPFDPLRCIGSVLEVTPYETKVNLPFAAKPEGKILYGNHLGAGEVGEFIFIECGNTAIFGRIVSVKLPERERLSVESELGQKSEAHPFGTVQLLASVNLKDGSVESGLTQYPRLGCRVFSAHPELVTWIAESSSQKIYKESAATLDVAYIPDYICTPVRLLPEHIFGRHCTILGATGGGKSWTIARLIEEAIRYKSKIILMDATGEFHTLCNEGVYHVHFGSEQFNYENCKNKSVEVVFPYTALKENDLFAIFTPSGQTQAPKLRAAMKSLKLARLKPELYPDGIVKKADQDKESFYEIYRENINDIENPLANFNIYCLTKQIEEECIWPSKRDNPGKWGPYNESEFSYCISLITRIEDVLSAPEFNCIFKIEGKTSILDELESFLKKDDLRVFRISLKNVSFSHNVREVLANAIGRHLLTMAREGRFQEQPIILFLDEAHQFLNKTLGDENNRYSLDAFELIAKEGRKFSLNICISTQRPRDIPEGVLSQMGALIVHRLTNDRDREVVERACGEFSKSVTAFLPNLVPGEAMIVGVDFPIPVTVQISEPTSKPDSMGPDFQKHWR